LSIRKLREVSLSLSTLEAVYHHSVTPTNEKHSLCRANRAERLRVQALKNDDQEAYLKMVAESKNERLKTLLGKTDELLERLGQMVQLQKETDDIDPVEERLRKKNPERHKEQGQEVRFCLFGGFVTRPFLVVLRRRCCWCSGCVCFVRVCFMPNDML
jgi:hypothetical protein